MAENGGPTGRDAVILALASGKTVRDAARQTGVGGRTITRWRSEDPKFRLAVDAARDELFEANFAALVGAGTEAVATLQELLRSESDSVRLNAARTLLDLVSKHRESVELQRRLASLEQQLDEQGDPSTWDCEPSAA